MNRILARDLTIGGILTLALILITALMLTSRPPTPPACNPAVDQVMARVLDTTTPDLTVTGQMYQHHYAGDLYIAAQVQTGTDQPQPAVWHITNHGRGPVQPANLTAVRVSPGHSPADPALVTNTEISAAAGCTSPPPIPS